jgi:hypothetical protein
MTQEEKDFEFLKWLNNEASRYNSLMKDIDAIGVTGLADTAKAIRDTYIKVFNHWESLNKK